MNNFNDDICNLSELHADIIDAVADMKPYDRERYLIDNVFNLDSVELLKSELTEMRVRCGAYETVLDEHGLLKKGFNEFKKISEEYYASCYDESTGVPF